MVGDFAVIQGFKIDVMKTNMVAQHLLQQALGAPLYEGIV